MAMNYRSATAILGTATNDDAATGFVGEFVEGKLLAASSNSLATATPETIVSIAPTAGDWDVNGVVAFTPGATTSVTVEQSSTSLTDNTVAGTDEGATHQFSTAANVVVGTSRLPTPTRRMSIAITTTVYLVAVAVFTVSTMAAFGHIRARRVR